MIDRFITLGSQCAQVCLDEEDSDEIQIEGCSYIVVQVGGTVDMEAWLNARPAFTSNGAAADPLIGNLAVGKTYWAANGNTEISEGAFMRVV